MKRTIVTILAFAAVLCAASSCKYDKCKCTTVSTVGNNEGKKEQTLPLPDGKKCSDLESNAEVGSISTKTTCKPFYE